MMNLVRFVPVPEMVIVAALACGIFGPHTLLRMRHKRRPKRRTIF